ncbi:ABC transporter ATP-binding protein [Leptothoe spongobia]|uniref:ABC transporter ATP-binding protein n=1 Tax=Leptothoe spongobia TAU-MAC 1115 TaxID=1967444 RepID=A0A947DI35_9CYAN|nr:ABC transporter ATP-binding protein [Leptothoe spongobia]MBT9316769.1 ABC transporter ATP-binding protein [Leptothoe spongobia TAU-MAC 1115]
MSDDISISLTNVSKAFKRYHRPVDRLKEILLPGKQRADEFWALQNINLEIPKGETIGIIGRNGSGKSTLLQIIAGTLQPTTGNIKVNGRVSALLELGSGFNPEFTGRQNVFFNGRILGLSQDEIAARFDEIADFADIGDFIDQPVKTYSSGMFVRLAFAVAVHVEPEVLIVDEALAVGDVVFQHKCMRRIKALMDANVTTLFVSHDASAVKTLCKSAFMLEAGKFYASGAPNDVFIEYMKLVTEIELNQSTKESSHANALQQVFPADNKNSSQELKVNPSRRGSGRATIDRIQLFHENGDLAIASPIFKFNENISFLADVSINAPLESFILGFFICDKNGNELFGSNTKEENVAIGSLNTGDKFTFKFSFKLPLRAGGYSLTVAGAEDYTTTTCDWLDNVTVFTVEMPRSGRLITASVDIPVDIDLIVKPNRLDSSPSPKQI